MDGVPLAALEAEWRGLVRGELGVRFDRWAAEDAGLAGYRDPDALIAFLLGPGDPGAKDGALLALVSRARGEPLAGRVVVQALLPGLKALSARLGRTVVGFEEVWQILFFCLWERILTYPVERRPSRVAANLLLDTQKWTLRELKREQRERAQHENAAELPLGVLTGTGGVVDVEAVTQRAVAAGALTAEEMELLLVTLIDGVPLAQAGERLGVSYNAVKIRRQRAEVRLLKFLGVVADPSGRSKRHSLVHEENDSVQGRLLRPLPVTTRD